MNPSSTAALPLPGKAGVVAVATYLVAYVFLDWVSLVDPYGPLAITPWNPPPGLSIFMVLRYGATMAPWLGVAAFAAEIIVRDVSAPWPAQAAACAWLAAAYTCTALLLRRRPSVLATLRDATVFVATAAGAALVTGMGFIAIFVAAGVVAPDAFPRTVAQFWIGDLIGIVVTTPLLLTLTRRPAAGPAIGVPETVAQIAAIGAALVVVFGLGLGAELQLFYLLFLPLIWIAMRRGLTGTVVATALIQVGLIAALTSRDRAYGVLDFQFLMLALALTGLFIGVIVEERRRVEQKLRDKQFELDRSLRAAAASELASALAHELNQPLSAVASYTRACQILLERGDPQGELPAIMQKVVAEANRAGTVVHRLREFVRSGTIRQERLAAAALLANAVEAAAPRAARHRVTFAMKVAPDAPEALADRVQVEAVLHNLIVNAIDALRDAPGDRRITLAADRHEDGCLRITVADNGPGLSVAARESLFEPFATSKAEGLGLGLAISRTIVQAHGGVLWLSPAQTETSFCLTLPAAR